MNEFLVFGDIAGRFKEMMMIINKAPKCTPVSVGDMNDRGVDSKKVLHYFMKNGRAVKGNHEHLMIDYIKGTKYYDDGVWGGHMNGAFPTMQSFGIKSCHPSLMEINRKTLLEENKELITWMDSNPLWIEGDDYIITHAAINPAMPWEKVIDLGESYRDCGKTIIWNHGRTRRRTDDKFQIHGHMAHKRAQPLFDKQGNYGINLDSSFGQKLTALHWPSGELFEQEYLMH